MIIVNYKKIFGIIITSSIMGFVINYINPEGIPLIREKQEIKWAPDSLFMEPDSNNVVSQADTTQLKLTPNNEQQKQINETPDVVAEKKSKLEIKNPTGTDEKITKEKKEVVAFSEPQAIKLEQAFTLYNKGVLFIDARDSSDYIAGHITGSINIPFEDLDNYKQQLERIPKDKPLVVYCAGTECDLSPLLANILFERGYKQVYVFFGGWVEWQDANDPIEHPSEKKPNE